MMTRKSVRLQLIGMNFLEFAVWGSYLISMGALLFNLGFKNEIGYFYSVQGLVSLFMPTLIGVVADRWIPAQKLLGICHLIASLFIGLAGLYIATQETLNFSTLFTLYTLSVSFYMPTLALSNSVAYTILNQNNLDTIKEFPPIRIFGTIGFIIAMISVSLLGYEASYKQFYLSAILGLILAFYSFSLSHCPVNKGDQKRSLFESLGFDAFKLFKQKRMAIFFIFSMLLGVSLQITNGFGNVYISSFKNFPAYAHSYFTEHANILISFSQISETLCILLIPFFLKRFGIKVVMSIATLAWGFRFAFLGLGNPAEGVWLFFLSMLVYGVAFDFFNVSGSLFVDKETSPTLRSSAQGLFMMMTNGLGASIGTLGAQWVVNHFVYSIPEEQQLQGWQNAWFIFSGYAFIVAFLFMLIFKEEKKQQIVNH